MLYTIPLLAASVAATEFGLMTIRSGDIRVHMASVSVVDNELAIHGDGSSEFELNPKGAMFVKNSTSVVTVGPDNSLTLSEARGSGPWTMAGAGDGALYNLEYMGTEPYLVCYDTGKIYVNQAPAECSTVIGVELGSYEIQQEEKKREVVSSPKLGYIAVRSGSPGIHLHEIVNDNGEVKIKQEGDNGEPLEVVFNGGAAQVGDASFLGVDKSGKLIVTSHGDSAYYNTKFGFNPVNASAVHGELTIELSPADGTTDGFYACPDDGFIIKVNGECTDATGFDMVGI